MQLELICLRDVPQRLEQAARWFHEKWGIPLAAYRQSMADSLCVVSPVPAWYLAVSGERILGGLGVIENDFHPRTDLRPNVCAVYTEEDFRCHGIAGRLLHMVVEDMRSHGIAPLYLLTDHTGFYERYGWEFLCMVQGDGESRMSRMYLHR